MRKRKPLALAGIGLTAITMFLLTPVFLLALAGCGSASKTSTPAPVIAATGTTCSKRSGDGIKECIVTLSDQPVEQAARRHGRIRQSAPPQSQDRTRQP